MHAMEPMPAVDSRSEPLGTTIAGIVGATPLERGPEHAAWRLFSGLAVVAREFRVAMAASAAYRHRRWSSLPDGTEQARLSPEAAAAQAIKARFYADDAAPAE